MYNVYVYAACTVCVTIFSTGSKFKFYVVTRSYSSPCSLVLLILQDLELTMQ